MNHKHIFIVFLVLFFFQKYIKKKKKRIKNQVGPQGPIHTDTRNQFSPNWNEIFNFRLKKFSLQMHNKN